MSTAPITPPPATLTDAPAGPTREVERLPALDVLRGFALFGIFCVNIHLFASPLPWRFTMVDIDPDDQWSRLAAFFVKAFCEYKFVSLFSLLFGAGFAILLERFAAKKTSIGVYYRRVLVLGVIGLLHGFLFWWGDILFIYAVIGCVLPLFRRAKPRTLALFGAGFIALSVLLFAGLTAGQIVLMNSMEESAANVETSDSADNSAGESQSTNDIPPPPAAPPAEDASADWVELLWQSNFDLNSDAWAELELLAYGEGPYVALFVVRAIVYSIVLMAVLTVQGFGFRVLGMFLIGMALYRSGFFHGRGGPSSILFIILGLGIGVLPETFIGWHSIAAPAAFDLTFVALESVHQITSVFLCLGMVGLFMQALRVNLLQPVLLGFAAVGRLALTNYLMQTLIATTLMYFYGLGLYGRTDRWEQLVIVALIYGLQICFSLIWLRWHVLGPMEWLWRWATYDRKPQLRRVPRTVPD